MFFNILFMFVVLYFCFLFCVFCVLVLLCVLFLLLCCLFPCFIRVYRPLPPGGNPVAVNKYNVMSCSNKLSENGNVVPKHVAVGN
jgi:hypothetical protein